MPLVVHHLNNSRSQRILWLLEEMSVPYTIEYHQRDKNNLAPESLKKIHPLGKSPVIVAEDHSVIAETGAIVEYLTETYPNRLVPEKGTPEKRLYTYWLHYAEGSLMFPLTLKLIFTLVPAKSPFLVRPLISTIFKALDKAICEDNLNKHFAFIENHLEKHQYFAGKEFTAADIQMSFPIESAISSIPNKVGEKTKLWIEKLKNSPSYKRALEKGGPYNLSAF